MADLDSIIDGTNEPELETVQEAPQEETVEQEAAPETDAPAEAAVEPAKEEPAKEPDMVPVGVVAELRQSNREMKAMLEAMRPKPQPTPAPDVFEDPEGYQNHIGSTVQNATTAMKLDMSRFMAEREFGADKVAELVQYFDQHPEQSHAFLNAPSPFHAAMEAFNQQRVASEIGSDPNKWAEAERAKIRAELEAEMVAKQARDTAGKFAPSMANVTGTGGAPKSTWTGPADLSSVIGE